MKKFIYFIIVTFLISCAHQLPQVTLINKFHKDEAIDLLSKGTSTIKGSALLRQQGGGVVTCAGNDVRLNPVTPYSSERIRAIYNNSDKGYFEFNHPTMGGFTNPDPDYETYGTRKTTCDAQGYFSFDNVKPGEYYVTTEISWRAGNTIQGGWIMRRIDIGENETKDIVLTY